MAWDIATARTVAGITPADESGSGADQDAALAAAMAVTLAMVERYLARGLLYQQETQVFQDLDTNRVLLYRWPVHAITSINGVAVTDDQVRLYKKRGEIQFLSGITYTPEVEVVYEGGYDASGTNTFSFTESGSGFTSVTPIPADLERVLWEIFLSYWSSTDQTTGAPVAGAGTTIIEGTGDVSSVTINDFGTVRFDVGAQAVNSAAGVAASIQSVWGPLAAWASTLQFYRSEHGAELGVA